MSEISLSRRSMLVGASAAAALGGALGAGKWQPALARAPMLGTQAPSFYRFKLGTAEATIVSDGILPLGDPHANFLGLTPEEMDKQLRDNFLPNDNAVLEQNALVLNTGDKLILFDTGLGTLDLFGPTTGKLMNSLKQAGINPEDIDAVVMSHAHIDHCGGCMADDGSRHFPNAEYFITEADYKFWTDETKVPEQFKVFLETARKNLTPNLDRLHFFKDGEEILPGIQAIYAPGHTVGHSVFMIDQGGQQLCYVGDLAHHPVLLLEKPLTEFKYDTDPKQSAQSRVKMLGRLADERVALLAYHFAWPGIGHVARDGDGFRYFPQPMQMQL
jgi:glyoxylase-like metal-dependent hydrolase (beta-lactamase superfamily II)